MPRVFAHAHLAALDTFLSFFWTLALLAGDRASTQASRRRDGRGRGGLVTCALDQDPCLVPVADPRGRRHLVATAAAGTGGHGRLGGGRNHLVLAGLAVALVFSGREAARLLWHGCGPADDLGPVFRPRVRRSRRALALSLVLFRGHCPGGFASPGHFRTRARLEHRRLDPLPLFLAGTIVVFLGIFSTRVPVYDGETALSACLSGLVAVDRTRGFGWLWIRFATRGRAASC